MGAGASSQATNATDATEFECKLSTEELSKFSSKSHFTTREIAALHLHYESISASQRVDGLIDRSEFQMALGYNLKESFYVDRMFEVFDINQDGFISFEEFVHSVSILSTKGTREEKTECTSSFSRCK